MFNFLDEVVEAAPKVPESTLNCTVVSLLPYAIKETKPSLIPGFFQIPGARNKEFELLHVAESIHWIESPYKGQPSVKITESSRAIAKSIVNDFIEAQLGLDSDAAPGLFFVEGHQTEKTIKEKFADVLKYNKDRQNKWFLTLIRLADDDWAQSHQHKMITDIQRYAAKSLNMDREWLSTNLDMIMVVCPLCKNTVRPDAIVHDSCGYILNPTEYAKMKDRIVVRA